MQSKNKEKILMVDSFGMELCTNLAATEQTPWLAPQYKHFFN